MMKSKYPNKIDSSSEIPVVRDGITEVSSEFFNSLRSAIIQIEKTLGINPQGSTGQTVGDRISTSLDQSGNLSRDALVRSNVLFGQVTNDNVASNASIDETKLNLTVPTTVLQSEISEISSLLNTFTERLDQLAGVLNLHISPYASGRHKATSINVESADQVTSTTSANSLDISNLQSALEKLYSHHINFVGITSSENKSHNASQIYFDNTKISEITDFQNLQEVVEDIAEINSEALRDAFSYLNSNGLTVFGKKTSKFEFLNENDRIVGPYSVTFSPSGKSFTKITFVTPILFSGQINVFDILKLDGSSELVDDGDYYIKSYEISGGYLISIDIFGALKTVSTGFVLANAYKNSYDYNNKNALNSTVRPRLLYTNTPEVAVCHPNAATIISSNFDISKLVEGEVSNLKIVVDDYKELEVSLYNDDLAYDEQSIDSVVESLNKQFLDNNIPVLDYKLRMPTCYELAISHLIPDVFGDSIKRSLLLTTPDNFDGTSAFGFSSSLDVKYYGKYGNPLHINGTLVKDFYSINLFDASQLQINSGTKRISLFSGTFLQYGIEVGDTVYVYNPENQSDEVVGRVGSISDENLDIDDLTLSFSGSLNDDSIVFILKNTVKISDLNFEIVSSTNGYMMIDALYDKDGRLFFNKRAEVSNFIQNGGINITVIDISPGYLKDTTIVLNTNASNEAYLTVGALDGEKTKISSSGEYLVRSPTNDGYITIRVSYSGPSTSLVGCDIVGLFENTKDIYHLSRFIFGPTLGRIFGFFGTPGIPNVIDKRIFGTIDTKQISSNFIEKYIEQPRHDLRGTGIISGCLVSNIQRDTSNIYTSFDITGGVCVVNGVRFTMNPIIGYKHYTDSDFYVAINKYGCLEFLTPDSDGNSPTVTSDINHAILAIVKVDGSVLSDLLNNETHFDLRFFIDRIDYKISKEIIVATDPSDGHFTDISSAVKYSSFFSKIYQTSGTRSSGGPTIKIRDGIFEINEQILINFDCQIVGSGQSTILRRGSDFQNAGVIGYLENIDFTKIPFIIGGGTDSNSSRIIGGVTMRDFSYETISGYSGASAVIAVTQSIGIFPTSMTPNPPIFRFNNINFYGPQNLTIFPNIVEYAIVLSRSDFAKSIPTDIIFGNIIINGCYFNFMGDESGIIKQISDILSSISKNVVITANIADNMAPNGSTDAKMFDFNGIKVNVIQDNNATND